MILLLIIPLSSRSEIINRILAVVGDKIITQYEVESFNPKQVKEIYSITDEEKRSKAIKEYYKVVLDFLVEQYTLEEIAKKNNVVVTDKEVDSAIKDILQRNNIEEKDLQEAIEKEGITMAQYKWQIKMDILSTRLKSRVINQLVVITEEDIKKYIDEHQKDVGSYDEYELRFILIKDKSKLSDVKRVIKEKGFIAAAIEFSEDKTAKTGGYLGLVNPDHLSKDLKDKIVTAKVKDLVEVESDSDVKLFYVESIKSRYDLSKEQREKIIAALMDTRYKDVYQSWIQKNKENVFVRYLTY